MFLSRVQLNPARRSGQPLLASPHAMHAAVLAAFPDPSPRPDGRVLWRLDRQGPTAYLYVVSPELPDFTHLVEQAGWPARDDTAQVRPYAPFLDRIEEGQRYGFRLTANPTRSARSEASERGKVYGHVTVAQQEQWLLGHQLRSGFTVDRTPDLQLLVRDRRTLSFSRRETRVTLRVATFEGTLTVTDRASFVHALGHGIGRAKGYGCGLLTLAPIA